MATRYTASVKLGTVAQRRRVVEGLKSLLDHCEALDSWPRDIHVNLADGTVEITMTREIPVRELVALGLNNDGAQVP